EGDKVSDIRRYHEVQGSEILDEGDLGIPVQRADQLTGVAAEEPSLEEVEIRILDVLVLGDVGHASPGVVELAAEDLRRAGYHASRTVIADTMSRDLPVITCARLHLTVSHDIPEEDVGAVLLSDEHMVAPNLPDSGDVGDQRFRQRIVVREDFRDVP